MALQQQNLNINFFSGLDTKTDPFQVPHDKFLVLQNSIFDKAGRLTKRNGFGPLTALPDSSSRFLSTFNGNLVALGTDIQALSAGSSTWINKGQLQPATLDTLPLIRTNTNQSYADIAISATGLACTVYTDELPTGTVHKYVIADSVTGQNVIAPTIIANADSQYGTPKVVLFNNYFTIVYTRKITATYHLEYIRVSAADPSIVGAPTDITAVYTPSTTTAFDIAVFNNALYVAWNSSIGGGAVNIRYITSTLVQSTILSLAGYTATIISLVADASTSTPSVYLTFYDLASMSGYSSSLSANLAVLHAPGLIISSEEVANLTSTADNLQLDIYYEVVNAYSYDPAIATNFIKHLSVDSAGSPSATTVTIRSVGLASKAFRVNNVIYFLSTYPSDFEPTYFLINQDGLIVAKLAASNACNYLLTGLPNVVTSGNVAQLPYLFKDLLQSVNKTQGAIATAGVYTQLGVGLAKFTLGDVEINTAEIGNTLNISGGFLWSYDGVSPVENGFFLYPEYVEATSATSGGNMADSAYFYQVTYEWTDNQGNLNRSAPSIPIPAVISGGSGSGSVQLDIPTLRLTYKTSTPVNIVIYRWSTAQQTYYQITSITSPLQNNTAIDSVTYTDTLADASIIGNNIIYTNGGVIENIAAPSAKLLTLFNNRLWLVDAEDRNLLWFSKQVIESTPVEMSDLFTLYVAPTTSSEGSTGPITAIAPMDDKLIVFKENALGYISGIGPDNLGSSNQYTDFTLITSVVGCENQNSIVFTPTGLMFQSNKGIWLLGRDLSTQYIGAPVEDFTLTGTILSALIVPGTNQVRFTLDSGVTLMYDYYFGQWGTFVNVPAISSVVYKNLHTYVNSLGKVFQETPTKYLDNTSPVLMKFTTSWINLAGIQGLERFYEMLMLGQYLSPFKLNMQLAYNYNPSIVQSKIVTPNRPGPNWGGDPLWGSGSPWGGDANVFESRIFPKIQKCESFQITMDELYDPSLGMMPGAGFTLSGLNLTVGLLRGTRLSSAKRSFG